MTKAISYKVTKDNLAYLTFNDIEEKVNKLSSKNLKEIESNIDKIAKDKKIKLLIILSGKENNFIAGADINEIKEIKNKKDALKKVEIGQKILSKIADLKIPTIAVINGSCLGGGLELALACKYRIASENPKTLIGLPEVNLGIIPGFGGTQRLPKIISLEQSLSMILSGKAINAKKALKIGLIDKIINQSFLDQEIAEFIDKILLKKYKRNKKIPFLEKIPFGKKIILSIALKSLLKKTKGHYPAPHYALEVIRNTYNLFSIKKGLEIELKAFSDLVVDETSKNMTELFFTNENLKKDIGIEKKCQTAEIDKCAILGAGVMGGGIAWLFAKNNIDVRIKDISKEALVIGFKQINKIFSQLKKIKKITDFEISLKVAKVSSTLDYSGFKNRDLIIEAVIEDIDIKKNILCDLEKNINKEAIIASNTSSLSISEMAKSLKNPERFVGMHFFNPVNKMPLIEVIRGEKTNDKTIATIVELSKKLGKVPIVVQDVAGFLVNRILLTYLNEASYILQEGGDIKHIDKLIEDFGMPMGPFTLADIVGIDVGVKVAKSLEENYGKRMAVAQILNYINDNHKELLGKKSNIGFYEYHKNIKLVNNNIYKIVKNINIAKSNITDQDIIDRTILIMVNEAAKCLEEGVVKNAKYLDMAMILGTGFPAFRGGLLRYADSLGIKNIINKLNSLSKIHKNRFQVCNLLVQMAKEDKKFYQ